MCCRVLCTVSPPVWMWLVVLLLVPASSIAGINQWTAMGTFDNTRQPYGGSVNALATDPENGQRIFAATVNGVSVTSDGGRSWIETLSLPNTNVSDVVVAPSDSKVVYATNQQEIYKSVDSGASWVKVFNGRNYQYTVYQLAVSPADANVVYAMSFSCKVFKSVDGGATWNDMSNGLSICSDHYELQAIAIDPSTPNLIYLAAVNGLTANVNSPDFYVSTDGGAHWVPNPVGGAGHAIFDIDISNTGAVYIASLDGLYKSTDRGNTWYPIGAGSVAAGSLVVRVDPVAPGYLYAGGTDVSRSSDDGATWHLQNKGVIALLVTDFAFDHLDPGQVYVSTLAGGVFASNDGGQTWSAKNNGLTNVNVNAIQVNRANGNVIYLGSGGNGVFKTEDGGRTWMHSNNGISSRPANSSIYISALAEDKLNPDVLYAATGNGNVHIYKTINGGADWKEYDKGLLQDDAGTRIAGYVDVMAINPQVNLIVYAGTSTNGLYKSTDGGATWNRIGEAALDGYIGAIAIDPTAPRIIYAGTRSSGIFKSTDGGLSWSQINNGLTVKSVSSIVIDPNEPDILYILIDDIDIYKSVNGGESWAYMSQGIPNGVIINCLAMDPVNSNVLVAGTLARGAYLTTDGGTMWTDMNSGRDSTERALSIQAYRPHVTSSDTVTFGSGQSNLSIQSLTFASNRKIYASTNTGRIFTYTYTSQQDSDTGGSDINPTPHKSSPPPNSSPSTSDGGGGAGGPLLLVLLLGCCIAYRRLLPPLR